MDRHLEQQVGFAQMIIASRLTVHAAARRPGNYHKARLFDARDKFAHQRFATKEAIGVIFGESIEAQIGAVTIEGFRLESAADLREEGADLLDGVASSGDLVVPDDIATNNHIAAGIEINAAAHSGN